MNRIAVFCGSSSGTEVIYREKAALLGRTLAESGTGIVYGGGRVGLMGVLADAALGAGGEVIGIIPGFLQIAEVAHQGLTEMIRVESMHERKALIMERSDGAVAMPGGYGTLDELFETLTWGQLGLHSKPAALYNINGYFDPLLLAVDRMVDAGFLKEENRSQLIVSDEISELLGAMESYQAPAVLKWLDLDGQ